MTDSSTAWLGPGGNGSWGQAGTLLPVLGSRSFLTHTWAWGSLNTHLLASSLFISSMRPPPPPPLLARLASDFEVPLGLEPPDASSG